jgi:hypothetical protein
MPQTQNKTADTRESAMREAERHGRGDADAGARMRTSDALFEVIDHSDAGPVAPGDRDRVYASYTAIYKRISKREDLVDAASEMSFPASDPPSYMGGSSVAGRPDNETPTEHPNTKVSDRATVKEVSPTDGTGTGGQTQGNTVRKTRP